MDHDDDFSEDTTDLAECAKINFETVARMAPMIAAHPIFKIAKEQLDATVARLRKADTEIVR